MISSLGSSNAVILQKLLDLCKINRVCALALQEVLVNAATRLQAPKKGITAHKSANQSKVGKPQPKRPTHTAKNTAQKVKKVMNW